MPAIMFGLEVNQFLGVLKILASTAEAQVTAIGNILHDWDLVDLVNAMCFDTTLSNTERLSEACVLLKQKLSKTFLHLGCCHIFSFQ